MRTNPQLIIITNHTSTHKPQRINSTNHGTNSNYTKTNHAVQYYHRIPDPNHIPINRIAQTMTNIHHPRHHPDRINTTVNLTKMQNIRTITHHLKTVQHHPKPAVQLQTK